ncbi:hypothetical protein C8J57DRAFT_1296122 [Mycena rebaudengoi]|nr:hypothetical protein C8J57DRAFT_1296122 [Mycena rebaudengoi]
MAHFDSESNVPSPPESGSPPPVVADTRPSRQTSCAECHRLKLKCNKEFPCKSCIRRGCESICPTGTLRSTGRGKRSVMSDVPRLTSVISQMGERIRALERAVANTDSGLGGSSDPHPLLSRAPTPTRPSTPIIKSEPLGSLSVNEAGDALYFGPTAGTEALFSIEGSSQHPVQEQNLSFTTVTQSFPFVSHQSFNWDAGQALNQLFTHLPSQSRAWQLCEIYYQNGCWTGMPILQDELIELVTEVYEPFHDGHHSVTTQKMAVLYLVFALASLVDLHLPPYSSEADHYFDLGCAAMSVKSLFEGPSVVTVLSLSLVAIYYAHGGRRFTMDGAWSMISLASNMAQRLGLHRSSFSAKLPTKVANRCQNLFWEVYFIETIYGLSVGRPTGTFMASISCPLPPDEDPETERFVKIPPGYRHARMRFTTQITAPIMETFLMKTVPSYETVVEMDQKIRKYMLSTPFSTYPSGIPENGFYSPRAFMQRNLVPYFSRTMLLYIHINFFMEAMRDNPSDPLASSYSASFLAAYRTASDIIKANITNFTHYPELHTRWWAIWKSLFSSSIIVGTVATKYPTSKMAPHALLELFTAVDIIETGAISSGRARSGLAILQRLRDKAIRLYSQHSGHSLTPPPNSDVEGEEELKIIAGSTRVLANKVLAHGFHSPPQAFMHPEVDDARREFDPSIVEYFTVPSTQSVVAPAWASQELEGLDAGSLFFTVPPVPTEVSETLWGPSPMDDTQWSELLQSL